MQSTTSTLSTELHILSRGRRSRPFVSSRGGSDRLQIHAVAVRDTSSERKPALLAGGVHGDKKKVLIVGAGWAGAGHPSYGPCERSVCTSTCMLWRHAPSRWNATCCRIRCGKTPVAAGLRSYAAGRIPKPWWPVIRVEDPTGPGSRSGWEHVVTLQAGRTALCITHSGQTTVTPANAWPCCTLALTITFDAQVSKASGIRYKP